MALQKSIEECMTKLNPSRLSGCHHPKWDRHHSLEFFLIGTLQTARLQRRRLTGSLRKDLTDLNQGSMLIFTIYTIPAYWTSGEVQ